MRRDITGPLVTDAPAAIESTIAALARCSNVIDAAVIARATPRRHRKALARHLRERPLMTVPLVRGAVLSALNYPDDDCILSRFDGVTDRLRFDLRDFA